MNKSKFVFLLFLNILFSSYINAQKIDRGFKKNTDIVFIPKGSILIGGTASYRQYDFDEYKFIILDDMKGNAYTFALKPNFAYFFSDNTAAGLRLIYNREFAELNNLALNLGEDMNFSITDYTIIQHSYTGVAFLRNYMNVGGSQRIGIFNEIGIGIGGGQGKLTSGTGEAIEGTYHKTFKFEIGLRPGLTVFMTDNIGIEASIGILSYNYKMVEQTTNQVYQGLFSTTGGSFKIDLLSLNLGISVFI